jgi:flagellar biogenesis protein FliO
VFLATAAALPEAAPALPTAGLPELGSIVPAVLVLAGLAIAALLLARRRRAGARIVQVLESAAIGPKRSIVVARVGDELLVLGSSEAGVQLLATKPAPPEAAAAAPQDLEESQASVLARMGLSRKPTFEDLLAESDADRELRRKLAAGRAARVP